MKLTLEISNESEAATAAEWLRIIAGSLPAAAKEACAAFVATKAAIEAANTGGALAPPDPAQVFGAVPVAEVPSAPLAPTIPTTAVGMPATSAPAAPVTSAPATPMNGPASSAAPAPSVEVDSAGVPWSPELHAANKAKCKDGTWKAKRGLTAAPAAPAPVAAPAAPAPVAAPAAPAPVAAPAAPQGAPTTYAQLMPRITAAVTADILPPAELRVSCESLGVPSIVTLQENASFVPLVWADLCTRFPAVATVQG